MSTKHKPDRPWVQCLLGGIITADHICRQYPSDPANQEAGKNLLTLLALDEPERSNPLAITNAVCQWVRWWMASQFVQHLDVHVLHLIDLQAAEAEYGLHVEIQQVGPDGIGTDVCTEHAALMAAPYSEPDAPPAGMRQRLIGRQCPPGHVRVLFTVPSLCVQVGLIAETEGLQP
jgi:hypothetical protein